MVDREKLIELVNDILSYLPWGQISTHTAQEVADHLLANGVILDDGSIPKIVGNKNCRSDDAGWYFNIRLQWHGKDWSIAHEIPTGDLCKRCFMKQIATDNNVGGKWIPVTERLPDVDKKILLLCKNGAMFVGVRGSYYGGTEHRFKVRTALNSTKLLNKGRVTHWMPLPEPPKEEADGK